MTSADLSEQAAPVPEPPPRGAFRPEFLHTVDTHLELFEIVTPVNVDRLKYLLSDHPNRPFVASVACMMHEGAWPWASMPPASYPLVNDQSQDNQLIRSNAERLTCFRGECEKELVADRFSSSFPSLCFREILYIASWVPYWVPLGFSCGSLCPPCPRCAGT